MLLKELADKFNALELSTPGLVTKEKTALVTAIRCFMYTEQYSQIAPHEYAQIHAYVSRPELNLFFGGFMVTGPNVYTQNLQKALLPALNSLHSADKPVLYSLMVRAVFNALHVAQNSPDEDASLINMDSLHSYLSHLEVFVELFPGLDPSSFLEPSLLTAEVEEPYVSSSDESSSEDDEYDSDTDEDDSDDVTDYSGDASDDSGDATTVTYDGGSSASTVAYSINNEVAGNSVDDFDDLDSDLDLDAAQPAPRAGAGVSPGELAHLRAHGLGGVGANYGTPAEAETFVSGVLPQAAVADSWLNTQLLQLAGVNPTDLSIFDLSTL